MADAIATARSGVKILLEHTNKDATSGGQAWQHAKDDQPLRMTIYSASTPGTSCKLYKAVVEVPYSLETLWQVILDLSSRMKWDGNIAALEGQVLEEVAPGASWRAFRSATKAVGPISARDFVDGIFIGPMAALPADVKSSTAGKLHEKSLVNGGAGLLAGHPAFPEQSGFVRGYNLPGCGWVLEPMDKPSDPSAPIPSNSNGWTRVHYLVQSDLKGWMPAAVVNASLTGMFSSFFGDLLKYMASQKV